MFLDHIYFSLFVFAICLTIAMTFSFSKISTFHKTAVVVGLISIGVLSYRAMDVVYGQPKATIEAQKNAIVVKHFPSKSQGVIYLWILKRGVPTTYTIPYSDKAAKQIGDIEKKKKGKPYKIDIKIKSNHSNPFKKINEDVKITPSKYNNVKNK